MGMEEWLDSVAYVQCVCYITFFCVIFLVLEPITSAYRRRQATPLDE